MAVAAVHHDGSENAVRPKSHIFGIPIDLDLKIDSVGLGQEEIGNALARLTIDKGLARIGRIERVNRIFRENKPAPICRIRPIRGQKLFSLSFQTASKFSIVPERRAMKPEYRRLRRSV